MGAVFYFTILAIQLSSTFSAQIPLRCIFQNNVLSIFSANNFLAVPSNVFPTSNSLRLDNARIRAIGFDKDGWQHEGVNVEFQGLENSILDEYGFNMVTNVSHITFHTDLFVSYPYKTSGSVLAVPIHGEGFAKVLLKNIQIGMTMPFDIVEINGNEFVELRNFNSWFNVRDNADFCFTNLYDGNKELSDSMHNILNKNWKFITSQFGKPFLDKAAESVFNVLRNYFLSMPLKNANTC